MKSTISAESLSLLLGTVAPAFSLREQQEKGKPQQWQQQQQTKPQNVKQLGLSATAPFFEDCRKTGH
jgi:hypothetical protein